MVRSSELSRGESSTLLSARWQTAGTRDVSRVRRAMLQNPPPGPTKPPPKPEPPVPSPPSPPHPVPTPPRPEPQSPVQTATSVKANRMDDLSARVANGCGSKMKNGTAAVREDIELDGLVSSTQFSKRTRLMTRSVVAGGRTDAPVSRQWSLAMIVHPIVRAVRQQQSAVTD